MVGARKSRSLPRPCVSPPFDGTLRSRAEPAPRFVPSSSSSSFFRVSPLSRSLGRSLALARSHARVALQPTIQRYDTRKMAALLHPGDQCLPTRALTRTTDGVGEERGGRGRGYFHGGNDVARVSLARSRHAFGFTVGTVDRVAGGRRALSRGPSEFAGGETSTNAYRCLRRDTAHSICTRSRVPLASLMRDRSAVGDVIAAGAARWRYASRL